MAGRVFNRQAGGTAVHGEIKVGANYAVYLNRQKIPESAMSLKNLAKKGPPLIEADHLFKNINLISRPSKSSDCT